MNVCSRVSQYKKPPSPKRDTATAPNRPQPPPTSPPSKAGTAASRGLSGPPAPPSPPRGGRSPPGGRSGWPPASAPPRGWRGRWGGPASPALRAAAASCAVRRFGSHPQWSHCPPNHRLPKRASRSCRLGGGRKRALLLLFVLILFGTICVYFSCFF